MVYLTSLCQEWLPSLPSQRLVTNTLDDADFGGKDYFCRGRKTPLSQIEINRS